LPWALKIGQLNGEAALVTLGLLSVASMPAAAWARSWSVVAVVGSVLNLPWSSSLFVDPACRAGEWWTSAPPQDSRWST
jgi:hypothetical protein